MTSTAPAVHLRSGLRAAGYCDDEVRQRVRAGELGVVRRGAYVDGALPGDHGERHLTAVRAASEQLCADAVFSHASAALLHGWPVWGLPLGAVHATRSRRTGGRVDAAVHVHAARLRDDEVALLDGVLVTDAPRTVADIARTAPVTQAVVVADAALASGDVDAESLARAIARQKGWPGAPRARRVLAFADGRSGSVGESRSRVAIAMAGLPAPELQHEFVDRCGAHVGTVDFWWPRKRVVGEFDGLVKYGRLVPPGWTAADVVVAEKAREDALRDLDLRVLRWLWSDLTDFRATAARLRERLS